MFYDTDAINLVLDKAREYQKELEIEGEIKITLK